MIPGWHSDFWTPSVFKNLLRKPPLCPAEVRDRKENLAFGYFLGAQLFTLQVVGDPKNSAPWIAPNVPRANQNDMF